LRISRTLISAGCAALVGGCSSASNGPPGGPSGPTDFTLETAQFHISSGGVFRNAGQPLQMYLTDQPDTCTAVTGVPVGHSSQGWMRLQLSVLPPTDGSNNAVIGQVILLPGQAAGAFIQQFQNQIPYLLQLTAASGNVSWFVNPDNSITLTELKVGFVGTRDTIATYNLTIVPCN